MVTPLVFWRAISKIDCDFGGKFIPACIHVVWLAVFSQYLFQLAGLGLVDGLLSLPSDAMACCDLVDSSSVSFVSRCANAFGGLGARIAITS